MNKKKQPPIWRNRITGHGEIDPNEILLNPHNWRTHPVEQGEALSEVLRGIGVVQSVVINRRTGLLVDGHLRVELARKEGVATIPVVYVDLSADEEAMILSTMDPLSAMAGKDLGILTELSNALDMTLVDSAVQSLLASLLPPSQESISRDGKSETLKESFSILIECQSEQEQQALLERLDREGYKCRSLIS